MPTLLADSLRRRFRYHAWASAALADALPDEPAEDPPDGLPDRLAEAPVGVLPGVTHTEAGPRGHARGLLAHALVADRVWLLRMRGEPAEALALWPALDARGLRLLSRRNADAYAGLLAPLSDPDLLRPVRYRTAAKERHHTALADVLEHVLLHGAHHRGQATRALRATGLASPCLDFVAWVRAGEPPPEELR